MKSLIRNHIYKLIYVLACLIVIYRIFAFEHSILQDKKSLKEGTICTVTCRVASLPAESYNSVSFIADYLSGQKIKGKLSINIKGAYLDDFCFGDTLTLRGTITHPAPAMNPGGFDERNYLKSQGASVIFDSSVAEINNHKKSFLTSFYKMRKNVTEKLFEYLPEAEASLVNALVTGSKSEMYDALKENYRRAGVYHVIAVSGLHLSMLIVFISALYINLKLKRRHRSLIAFAGTFGACMFMFAFTGFGVSVERAALMAMLVCTAPFLGREYSSFVSLFWVTCIVLISEPYSYCDVSFQLSFSATAGVLCGVQLSRKLNLNRFIFGGIMESFLITICATFVSMPFVVYAFKGFSIAGIVSNLVILMIVPVVLAMAYVFAIICMIAPTRICQAASYIIAVPAYAMNLFTDFFANLPLAYINISPGLFTVMFSQFAAAFVLLKLRKRKISLVLCVIFIIANFSFVSYNRAKDFCTVTFLNVGQGECALIRDSDGNTMMIDCGSESKADTSDTEVIPYLNCKGIYNIDVVVVTHYHDDHVNGILTLIERGYVEKLVVPDRPASDDEATNLKSLHETALRYNIPIERICKGDEISFGKAGKLSVLSPKDTYELDANNNSLVTSFKYEGFSFLFTADIEEYGMYAILDQLEDTNVIKVAHHGGRSALSDSIAQAAKAEYAVISCAKNNKYKHPHNDTLQAFKDSQILRTDKEGPITFIIKDKKLMKE